MDETTQEIPVKVLLVDDEENILHSLKRLLMGEEIDVLMATSGEKALDMLRADEDIGLIISDQRMPGLSGVDFLEQARTIRPLAVRIILTGYSDINAAVDAINRGGAAKYLTKPWKDDEIIMNVREACQRYALIERNKRLAAVVRQQNEELKQWSAQLEIMVQEHTIELTRQNDQLKKLYETQRKNFKAVINSLSGLIELRDKRVKSHSRNVAEISSRVALAKGLSKEEAEVILVASLLHDIGKIGLSDFLLTKDMEELSAEEMGEYTLHPIRGQAAIDGIEELRQAGLLIRHHHEAFDGTGFPDGLKGNDIPLGSRIIAMADFVDRIMGSTLRDNAVEFALNAVDAELGKRFDPGLFNPLQQPVTEIYTRLQANTEFFEHELLPTDLKTGMVLSRDIWSGTGLLLLGRGVTLDRTSIQAIKRYYEIDPPKRGVFIRTKMRSSSSGELH